MASPIFSEVLKYSEATKGDRLVILALADEAGKETREARCSIGLLAAHAKLSERAVQYSLRRLVKMGEVSIVSDGGGRNCVAVYRINELPVEEKGARVAPFSAGNGATLAPFNAPERVQTATGKGANGDTERVQTATDSLFRNIIPLLPNMSSNASRGSTARDQAKAILAELNRRTFKQPNRGFPPTDANLDLIVARIRETDVERTFNTMVRMILKWWGTDMQEFLRPATIFGQQKFSQYVGELGTPVRRPDGRPVKVAFTPEQLQRITAPLGDCAQVTR
jgi:uncharacterized phage protein (TIGR02220 family)